MSIVIYVELCESSVEPLLLSFCGKVSCHKSYNSLAKLRVVREIDLANVFLR